MPRMIGRDKLGNVTVERDMQNYAQAEGWAKNYANSEYNKGESFTVYDRDGNPVVTHHNTRK